MKPEEISTIRLKLNLTQEQFAHLLGVTYSTINRVERGKNKPSPMLLEKIKKAASEEGRAV